MILVQIKIFKLSKTVTSVAELGPSLFLKQENYKKLLLRYVKIHLSK